MEEKANKLLGYWQFLLFFIINIIIINYFLLSIFWLIESSFIFFLSFSAVIAYSVRSEASQIDLCVWLKSK